MRGAFCCSSINIQSQRDGPEPQQPAGFRTGNTLYWIGKITLWLKRNCVWVFIKAKHRNNSYISPVFHVQMLIKHINILSGGALVLTFAILTLILSFFLLLDSRTQSVGWNHLSRFPLLASGIVYSGLQDKLDYIYSSLCSLKNCGVTEAGCEFLSKALSLNPSHLRVLTWAGTT